MRKVTKRDLAKKSASIAELCIRITQETEHDVFFSYSAHVDRIQIDLHINGWIANNGPDRNYEIYLYFDGLSDEFNTERYHQTMGELKHIEKELSALIEI